MGKLATISLNFSDGEKEIIGIYDNPTEIILECIRSASEGKTIYSISAGWQGCLVQRREPGRATHDYVSGYRNGEYTWVHDFTYAKHFSKKTAVAHTKELIKRGE